jgi:hypothetical protein
MQQRVVVSIPHRLGKQEALRPIQGGLGRARTNFGTHLTVLQEDWTDDHLAFRVGVLGQTTGGTIDVAEDHVRLEMELPWLLAQLAEKAKALIQKQGQLMLENK